ncbi:MAG: NAD(P)/FAD-dependent oxidoreductase [Pseudomonadota bacterium]
MQNPDVIIVGAGAAGVGAGIELTERGISCLILEAADRIGGRAFTDKTSLSHPWDHGCHWFHSADKNPLVPWADKLGTRYNREDWEEHFEIWSAGKWEDRETVHKARAALESAYEAVEDAAEEGNDDAMSSVLPDDGRWNRASRYIIALLHSEDPERLSILGAEDYEDTEKNWPVISGYGDLIERMAKGLNIRLGLAATAVVETPTGIRVETVEGAIEAKAAIITTSTNVLSSGAIEIGHGPARDLLDLIADIPCGAYEKVAITLSHPLVSDPKTRFTMVDPGEPASPLDFQVIQEPGPMMIAHLGGDFAREWIAAGEPARMDFALERLEMAFGAEGRAAVTGIATTNWLENPFVQGAYSYALPNRGTRRHEMIEADTGRIAFAGEAFSLAWQATAHGAYQSGRDVAARVAGHVAR